MEDTRELSNVLTEGTQVLELEDSVEGTVNIPINEDYCFLGKIVSYAKPKLTVEKAWDKAEPRKQFIAIAKFIGKDAEPEDENVITGAFCLVQRVGVGNNNFSGTPTSFQLDDEADTGNPSFIALFAEEE